MEETTNMTEQVTHTENMRNESEAQGTAQTDTGTGKEQKLFTQEEVNSLIQSRISRLKGQIGKESQVEYMQKIAELEAREMKLMVKEQLTERGMPKELADIITCTDEKDIANKLDKLQKIYGNKAAEQQPTGFIQVGAHSTGYHEGMAPDPVRRAMGLK